MKKIGLIVNPIAGMGGSVGLKGTDGEMYKKAMEMGAFPVTPQRISNVLSNIKNKKEITFLVAPNKMGEDFVKDKEFSYTVIGEIGHKTTTSIDTKRIAKKMLKEKIELLIFCGGDGTARDIFDAIDLKIPVVAIPSGVKMFSAVFALNPRAAAKMVDDFLNGTNTVEKEVLDINEDSFRKGLLDSRLYGYLKVPKVERLIQAGKQSSKIGRTIEENKNEIAKQIIETMKNDTLYLLGPGTTVKAISNSLNLSKALLGIDAIYNKKLIDKDINEKGILDLLNKHENVKIIVSPIGGNGFIFGRGNKQFTPKVLRSVGKKNVIIVSTEDKVKGLQCLRVDTGDIEVDNMLKGFGKVLIGYKEELIIEIEC
ncbi:MAG: ATP-NAD kinase family protein [Promethearchaeota archaeon]